MILRGAIKLLNLRETPIIEEAIQSYHSITATLGFYEIERLRSNPHLSFRYILCTTLVQHTRSAKHGASGVSVVHVLRGWFPAA